MNAIHNLADGLRLSAAQTVGTLTMVPLLRTKPATMACLDFSSALKQGLVDVTELGPGGSVPEVQVVNRAGLPVLFLDGEALVGAKQNRVLNLTVLVPAKATTVIPVSCVEAGRWSPRSRAFGDGESLHFAGGRASKLASVSAAMAAGVGRRSDQRQVWDNMDDYRCDLDADAPSGAMQDVYDKVRGTVQSLIDGLHREEGQVGAAFLLRGELVGLDFLCSTAIFGELYGKIARSYAVEALRAPTVEQANAQREPPDPAAVAAFVSRALAQLAAASWQPHPAIGLGTDLRLATPDWDGAALALDDELVHVAAFPRRRAVQT